MARLLQPLAQVLAKNWLREGERRSVGREVGRPGAEYRVVAADDRLPALNMFGVELDRRPEAGLRLVEDVLACAIFRLRGAVFGIAVVREAVNLDDGLRACRKSRSKQQQGRSQSLP